MIPSRSWWPRIGLALVGLALPFLGVELLLRLVGPVIPGNYETGVWAERHPIYGHAHIPRAASWIKTPEYVTWLRFNSLGMRGPEPSAAPRVLMLGDSFLEAKEVAEERSMTGLLRQRAGVEGRPIDWLNSGVFDWGTAQQLLYFRNEAEALQPRLVLLFVYVGNDIADHFPRSGRELRELDRPAATVDSGGNLTLLPWSKAPLSTEDRVRRAVGERSMAAQVCFTGVLDRLRAPTRSARPVEPRLFELSTHRESAGVQHAWRVMDTMLGTLAAESSARGQRFGVVIIPGRWSVHPEEWTAILADRGQPNDDRWTPDRPVRRLAQLAANRGIPALNLLPAMRARAVEGERLYFHRDIHWNEAGHRVASDEVARFVQSNGLLP